MKIRAAFEYGGPCFNCRKLCAAKTRVFFGPGALVKCEACGPWSTAEWNAGQAIFSAHLAVFVPALPSRPPRRELPPPKRKPRAPEHRGPRQVRFWVQTTPEGAA